MLSHHRITWSSRWIVMICLLVLAACGGGGGGGGNTAPIANAGQDQKKKLITLVTLNGSASSDADGNALTYNWTLTGRPTGSTATLSNATSVNPTFTPDVGGVYTASLVVNDGTVSSSADTVTVTAGFLVPEYDPLRTADGCSATYLRTAGSSTGETFISATTGTETINYTSGPLTGKITINTVTSDGEGSHTTYNDGTSLKLLRSVDATTNDTMSTDCALTAHPAILSFDIVYNKMLVDGPFSTVNTVTSACRSEAATVLFTIQDVTVQGTLYPDAIIWWWMANPKQPYQTLNAPALTGFGITAFPTSTDTGGFAVTDVDILGPDGFVAHVGIIAGTGATEEVAERTSQTCSSPVTRLATPVGVAVDAINNEIFVTNLANNSVTVYSRTANGSVAPTRTISGAATGLSSVGTIAVDIANNEIVVANEGNKSITVYSRTANGNVAPIRTISGAATGLDGAAAIAVDTVNNEILAANSENNSITVYSRTANGNVAPIRTISGAATGLDGGTIAVDTTNNEIVAANQENNSITVYSRTANGNVAPIRTISGAATGLGAPYGITLDTTNNEIFTANPLSHSVTVHSRTANGNVAPVRKIQ